jgi:DNA-binding beta-propeller fold protein YncE
MALQVDPLTNTLVVASLTGNKLTFISTETNQVTGEVATGIGPWDIALDSLYHKAYVANRGSYFVTVVDTIGHQIIGKIPLSSPAQAIAVDEKDHTVYITHPRSQNIDKINGETNEYITPIDLNIIPQNIVVDSDTQRAYISTKSQDRLFVIGPESVSSSLAIISFDHPFLVFGFIDVHGQDVTSTSSFSLSNNTLGLSVNAPDGGNLAFDVPRGLLDSKDGANDIPFRILFDGQPSEFSKDIEITRSTDDPRGNQTRSLDFYVPENTKTVTIVGTQSIL